jgi:hypothetical protein
MDGGLFLSPKNSVMAVTSWRVPSFSGEEGGATCPILLIIWKLKKLCDSLNYKERLGTLRRRVVEPLRGEWVGRLLCLTDGQSQEANNDIHK